MKKILIGTVTLTEDVVMYNNQFQYAASFETLKVKKGTYPIFGYESNLRIVRGKTELEDAYLDFGGIVIESNVGGKPGDHTNYAQRWRGYSLAEAFINGYDYFNKIIRGEFELRPEWGIELHDFVSSIDNKRYFSKAIVLKDGAELTYMD